MKCSFFGRNNSSKLASDQNLLKISVVWTCIIVYELREIKQFILARTTRSNNNYVVVMAAKVSGTIIIAGGWTKIRVEE